MPGRKTHRRTVQRVPTGTDIAYPPDRIPVVRAIRGEQVYAADLEIHRPDRVVPVEVWATPIRNDRGEIEFAVAAFNDITERLENQKKIDRLNSSWPTRCPS